MEREVFEEEEAAALLNEHFICIKVDREERPDLDSAYMAAMQLLTRGGGWPANFFLTPDLVPFYALTYAPANQFMLLAKEIARIWRDEPGQARTITDELRTHLDQQAQTAGEVPADIHEQSVKRTQAGYDWDHGGLASRMKFPVPSRWRYLLYWFRKSGDGEARRMAELALRAMAGGGIRDHVEGGFHRYAVDRAWTVPHFEKMLYDNAQLAVLYAEAAAATSEQGYLRVALDTLEFMLRDLRGGGAGGFYASLDADSEGGEGSYYVWTPDELKDIAGEDGEALCLLLGVQPEGNFEGRSVLTRGPA